MNMRDLPVVTQPIDEYWHRFRAERTDTNRFANRHRGSMDESGTNCDAEVHGARVVAFLRKHPQPGGGRTRSK